MEEMCAVREFLYEHEASIVKSLLEANGIESYIKKDDLGGNRAQLSFGSPIKLMVRKSDFKLATEIINSEIDNNIQKEQ